MTNADAVRAATVVGARTIGEQASVGTLAAGRTANFVVLGADPLQDIRNLRNVILVVKHGIAYPRSAYKPFTAKQ
jgi:imidazolonepropionase-like amidohydrolase